MITRPSPAHVFDTICIEPRDHHVPRQQHVPPPVVAHLVVLDASGALADDLDAGAVVVARAGPRRSRCRGDASGCFRAHSLTHAEVLDVDILFGHVGYSEDWCLTRSTQVCFLTADRR